MASQTLIWSTLPRGYQDGRLQFSLHLAPRLDVAEGETVPIDDFPDFVDWPAVVRSMTFGITPASSGLTRTSDDPDSDLWKAIVKGETRVERFVFDDFSSRPTFTNGAAVFARFLRERYRAIHDVSFQRGDRHPPIGDVLTGLDLVEKVTGPRGEWLLRETIAEIEQEAAAAGHVPVEPITDERTSRRAFAQFARFHQRLPDDRPLEPFDRPEFDFHNFCALMTDYPYLMRKLGLVTDFELPVPELPLPIIQKWGITPDWDPQGDTHSVVAACECVFDGTRFVANHRGSTPTLIESGYLRFEVDPSNPYAPIPTTFDVDGSVFGIKSASATASANKMAYVRSLAVATHEDLADVLPTGEAPSMSIPALRSQGLGLAVSEYVRDLIKIFGEAKEYNGRLAENATDLLLFSDTIMQGFRFDVLDTEGGPWRPLQARVGKYALPTRPEEEHTDEGTTSPAATAPIDNPDAENRIPESMLRWDGWSLAAPRPGKRISTGAEGQGSRQQQFEADSTELSDFGLGVTFTPAPGSLPRLRFGHSYRIRARTVDLAGNSLPPTDDDVSHATDAIPYGRFEPVPAPAVLLTAERTPGETPERLVIRSEDNTLPQDSDVLPAIRHVLPQRTSVHMAECHGLLDDNEGRPDPGVYAVLAARDAGDLATLPGAHTDDGPGPDPAGAPYFPDERLDPPYLSDPLARGALMRFEDGSNLAVEFTQRDGNWYDVESFRIQLVAGEEGPPVLTTPASGSRVVQVPLPRGRRMSVLLSCYLRPEDVEQMGLWEWLDGSPETRQRIVEGRDWFFTPYRVVDLVHAVRQPLMAPVLDGVVAERGSGDTVCRFTLQMTHSHTSTGRVEVMAQWTGPVDDGPGTDAPVADGLHVGPTVAFPLDLNVPPLESDGGPLEDVLPYEYVRRPRHEFGDTRHRTVTYLPVAATKYAEYFTETAEVSLVDDSPTVVDVDSGGFAPDTVVVKSEDGERNYTEGTDYVLDEAAGSVARLPEGSIASGERVTVRYLAGNRPTTNPPDPTSFDPIPPTAVTISVPSSKRPEAPVVVSAIPTFAWERWRSGTQVQAVPDVIATPPLIGGVAPEPLLELRQVTNNGIPGPLPPRLADDFYSFRWANTIRLYLQRPWWTSGEGELLAVLYGGGSGSLFPDSVMLPYITRWGQDPVHQSGLGPWSASPFHYPNAVPEHSAIGVLPVEMAGLGVTGPSQLPLVASHVPEYDGSRDLWRCDVDIWTNGFLGNTYAPFVQLCVARYQPDSIAGAELSPLVHLDPIQLQPHRWLGVNTAADGFELKLAGPGGMRDVSEGGGNENVVVVTVERRDPAASSPDSALGWVAESETVIGGEPVISSAFYNQALAYWMWQGFVQVPDRTGRRLVIEEFEEYGGDPIVRRLVYAETVEL